MAWIVCTTGSDKGLTLELVKDSYMMGRAQDCDLVLSDDKASRYHCRIGKDRKGYWVEDVGSTNGVKFKGKRLKGKRAKVKVGQAFAIGRDCFHFTTSPPNIVEQAARDVMSGLSKQSRNRVIEKTYLEAVSTKQHDQEPDKDGFSLLDLFRHKKD